MSGIKIDKVFITTETNKNVSERSRLGVSLPSSKSGARNSGGYNDEALGAIDRKNKCTTCGATRGICHGHFGSYDLKYPIITAVLMGELINVLKVICHTCRRPRGNVASKNLKQLATSKTTCIHCGEGAVDIFKNRAGTGLMVSYNGKERFVLSNKKIYDILTTILDEDAKALGISKKIDSYLMIRLCIIPNNCRVEPPNNKPGQMPEVSISYKNVIEKDEKIKMDAATSDEKDLTDRINEITGELYKGTVGLPGHPNMNLAVSLKNKDGLVRGRIMGKRVSHISRSVITGDANLKPHEIGLNVNIASAVCIQEKVTEFNVTRLRALVANGDNWPGAKYVVKKTGSKNPEGHHITKKIRLYDTNKKDITISAGDVVYRHLTDGDFALLNRQPTLMPQSMAGMQIKVSHTSFTITLNAGSCFPFNADFDGDNMNCSFASTTAANNELRTMSHFSRWTESHQNIAFTLGTFQDTTVGGAKFTMEQAIPRHKSRKICADPDIFLNKGDAPVKIDGKDYYTGHNLLSKIIPGNINISKKSIWDGKPLEIVKGVVKSGIMDKGNAGQAVEGSLFHEIAINNGSDEALNVLAKLQSMLKRYQGYYTVSTIGAKDMLFSYSASKQIKDLLKERIAKVECLYENAYNGRLVIPAGKTLEKMIEEEEFKIMYTADEIDKILTKSLDKHDNNIMRLIKTGSRGNMSAAISIFGSPGYVRVDGGRMPYNMGNRVYLSSPNYPIDPVHKGCILNPFRIGISNREIFAAATDARESFISNALNTAIAGTLTKHLNKCMDSLIINYFYGVSTHQKIIQTLCYNTGFALHRLVKVNMLSLVLSRDDFIERYGDDQELLDERTLIRNAFIEKSVDPRVPIDLPFDITREIVNSINNFHELKGGELDESTVEIRKQAVIDEISKIFFNNARDIEPTPDMASALRIIKFTIRVELSLKRLKVLGVSDSILDIILAGIIPALTKALVQPCEAIGVMISYILGEPLTQYSLDSKHRSGGAGGQNLDAMVRMREIFACKPAIGKLKNGKYTPAMEMPLMFIHVREDKRDKINDYVNELEMTSLKKITKNVSILFERKNNSEAFPKENHSTDGTGYIYWCLRYELDDKAIADGGYKIRDVVNALTDAEPNLRIESIPKRKAGVSVIRVYIKKSKFDSIALDIKKYRNEKIPLDSIRKKPMLLLDPLSNYLLNTKIRGMKNIIRASIEEKKEVYIDGKDNIITRTIPYILLVGFNYNVLFEDYVDEELSYTNSVMDMNEIYGLPVARNRLIDELNGTISTYSRQHCTVLADQMASTGKITTIHRNGIIAREGKNIMLLAYERGPFKTFVDAGLKGITQKITGPTPSIMTGQRVDIGTGKVIVVAKD